MESVQDLLAPEKINIPIVEDPKTGEVSAPGASVVRIQNIEQFLQVLKVGEANRHAANTKLNTESSRSHAILMVNLLLLYFIFYLRTNMIGVYHMKSKLSRTFLTSHKKLLLSMLCA